MRVVVLAQEDGWVIPDNIVRLSKIPSVEIIKVVTLNTKGSLVNRKSIFLRGFGLIQAGRMAAAMVVVRVLDLVDHLTSRRFLKRPYSLRGAAERCAAGWAVISDPNASEFLVELRGLEPDLVVSFSAPCVFKSELLMVPRLGCVNLHCSLLPNYAGLLPSFWVLFEEQNESGATVHYMDDKIDNGAILGQVRVPLTPGLSMFQVIRETKSAGGIMMAECVRQLLEGTSSPIPNNAQSGSYFTWPTVEQMRAFRRQGGKLI